MYIETYRLIIRDIELADENAFIDMASDGSLDEDIFCGCNKEYHEWMKQWIEETLVLNQEDNPRNDFLAYTIIEKEKNCPIGSVGCSYYEDLDEVGVTYFIGSEYRGHGYAAEAVNAYVNYFLTHYNLHRIIATIKEANKASCKVIEKAGFELFGYKMYKDIGDEEEQPYNFYIREKNSMNIEYKIVSEKDIPELAIALSR